MMALILLAALQDPRIEIEARGALVGPKFRLRDGEKNLKGESVFSKELDAEGDVFSPGGSVALRWGAERFHFEYWRLTAEGDGVQEQPKAWGGGIVPAGTATETEVLFEHMEVGWAHRFDLYSSWEGVRDADPEFGMKVWIDAGLCIERMVVDAALGFGGTRLGGVFPTPQLSLGFHPSMPLEWLEISATAGGFFIPWRSGDTTCLDPIEYTIAIRARWGGAEADPGERMPRRGDRYAVGLGYDLYHVHLEERANHVDEDVVHLRLSALFASLEVRF